jgi:hydroxymethylglutaryl-CoA synthase
MVGITSYGAYIPWHRINRMTIYMSIGFVNPAAIMPGEKAVANYDEDSLTMAVNAGMDCIKGMDRSQIDGIYMATTTGPFKERQNAGIISTALDIKPEARTADFTASVKAGTTALLAAYDAVKAGTARNILVCASDCRLGPAGSYQEEMYGDGAAVVHVGKNNVIAEVIGSHSISYDFIDHWRIEGERFNRTGEDRFTRDEGFSRFISETIGGLMKKYKLNPQDISKVCYPCMYPRPHVKIGQELGFQPNQIQDHMFTTVGFTGAASPLMILVAALENAKPGDKIIVASYGNGGDAILLEVTPEIEKMGARKGIKKSLTNRKDLASYNLMVTFNKVLTIDVAGRGEEFFRTSTTILWRDRKKLLGLIGTKCKKCKTPQWPPQRVCINPKCGAIDQMEEYRFADRPGRLFTYTGDMLAFSPTPPEMYGMIDFDGGGRALFNITDCNLDDLKVNIPMEMTFRKRWEAPGFVGYGWKGTPIKG